MRVRRITLLATTIFCLLSVLLWTPHSTTATKPAAIGWFYVEVQATVYKKGVEVFNEYPSERRWYFSNVIVMPDDVPDYSMVDKKVIPYFEHNIVEPLKSRGLTLDYDDNDVRLNGDTSVANYASKAEADAARVKEIEYRKEQGGNIYSFELDFKSAKGEETSKPKLFYRDKEQPIYEGPKQ